MKERFIKAMQRVGKKWRSFSIDRRLLLTIAALALTTRLYRIFNKELWFDEVLDIVQAQKSIAEIFFDVKITPLHYLFVHAFSWVSSNIEWMRVPSVIFGAASVVLFYYTIKKITDTHVALFSAFMLAISPMIIEFSQQILHYSYFVFFTILTLYFYFDLVFKDRLKLSTALLFIAATILNITTHLSAILVLQLQGIFFLIYYLVHFKKSYQKLSDFFKVRLNTTLAIAFVAAAALAAVKANYLHVFTTFSRFNSAAPIPLGYSLTSQLKTGLLKTFTLPFYQALFSWFGNGGDYQLVIFAGLFIVGLVFMLLKRKFWIFAFTFLWVLGPFGILNISRMSHWFEEKYFIFVIPVYLYAVSYAVVILIEFVGARYRNPLIQKALYLLAAIAFLMLSVGPINTRTTYGYKVEGDQQFSWKKAIASVREKMGTNDILMAIDDKFLRAYLGRENKNKTYMSEEDLIYYTPKQYMDLVNSSHTTYYLSIPDVTDMRIGTVISYNRLGLAGGFNTYTVNFQKAVPVVFTGSYVENFMKMTYLKDATDWSNVLLSYSIDTDTPYPQTTDETHTLFLVPKSRGDSYMTYQFKLKPPYEGLLLRVNYFEKKTGEFAAEIKDDKNRTVTLSNPITSYKSGNYVDETYDLGELKGNDALTVTYRFHYPPPYTDQLEVGLKSFALLTNSYNDPEFIHTDGMYTYDAELEAPKSKKWWTETITNFGWVQTIYGILYRAAGTAEDALVYKFPLPTDIQSGKALIETFTKDNAITMSISNDGIHYKQIAKNDNELVEIEHTYAIPSDMLAARSELYIKFQTQKPNRFASLRNLKLTLK